MGILGATMSDVCFFNDQASEVLQHVAVVLELSAMYLVYRDRRIYVSDTGRQFRASVAGVTMPKKNRVPEFRSALIVGAVAVTFELYQLATQYLGC